MAAKRLEGEVNQLTHELRGKVSVRCCRGNWQAGPRQLREMPLWQPVPADLLLQRAVQPTPPSLSILPFLLTLLPCLRFAIPSLPSLQEAELERMRNMLRVQAERDERRAQADREAYDRVKRAHAASKVADTPNAAEAAVRMAARDMRPIDICR